MPTHLEEFQGEQFQGYVESVPPSRTYPLARFLPVEPIDDIDFSYGVINNKYGRAASITGWNASTPLRDKKELEKVYGSIAKIQHGFRLDEKEILKFNRPRTEGEKKRAVEAVYNDTDELIYGVDDTEEYLRAQALYNGVLNYKDEDNDLEIEVTFDLLDENKITAATPWSDPASTPLTDIQVAVRQFQKTNKRQKPVAMHMTSVTEANLLQNEQVRVQVFGENNGNRIVTQENLRAVFTALGLPPYEINDDVYSLDGEEEVQFLADNKVVFLGADLGKTFLGPTEENNFNPGKFGVTKRESDPPRQFVRVGEAAFPGLQRPQAIVHLTV